MILRIAILVLPLYLYAQQTDPSSVNEIDNKMKWRVLRDRVEKAFKHGKLTREEADNEYAKFRAYATGKKIETKDPVLEKHFQKYGIENIDYLKNELLDQNIGVDQLDAVLGGILRLAHRAKLDGANFKMNPRLEIYFKQRIGLSDSQIDYIVGLVRRDVN
tara:strand:+ start:2090 stop:2572 length:483 start_codon:yes stop_codon:yes gene_type:complete